MRAFLPILAVLALACEAPAASHPGPCRAEWSVYKVVQVGEWSVHTPLEVGKPRVMYFSYGDTGDLVAVSDDQDGDGVIDNHREVEVVAFGLGGQRLWSRCHGECVYDDAGNMLSDRDPAGGDTLRYFYDCWE